VGKQPNKLLTVPAIRATGLAKLPRRYNEHGPAGMVNRQRTTSWRPAPMLSLELREELRQAIAGLAPDDCKRWTARAVAAWISQKLGCPVRVQRGWNYLQRLKHSQQLPRPQHRGGAPVLAAIGPTPEPVQTVDDLVVKGKALND
jgi:Winged helix-turn helix